jgi:hypothetical protein
MAVIARETARMSYPGSMSRGKKPVVRAGTKKALEDYYAEQFPMSNLWSCSDQLVSSYDAWHRERTREMAEAIRSRVAQHNDAQAVAAKFLNTFMHQLMKYESCRTLWESLHLTLDTRIFVALRKLPATSLVGIRSELASSPYTLNYTSYLRVQRALLDFVNELNGRPGAEFHMSSRIELNWLWV